MGNNRIVMDYVYQPNGSAEFRTVNIVIDVDDYSFIVELNSDVHIATEDLNKIVQEVNKQKLSRMKVDIFKECKVFLNVGGERFRLKLDYLVLVSDMVKA